jgi:hypothetical protein
MSARVADVIVPSSNLGADVRPTRRAAEWLALGLLGLLFFVPFLLPIHRRPQPAFDAEWVAAILLAGSAIAFGAMKRRPVAVAWPLPAWLIVMVALVAGQYAAGRLHYQAQLVLACSYAFAIVSAYWVGRTLIVGELRERGTAVIALILVAGAVVSVLIQCLQLLDVKGLPNWLYFEILDPWYRTRPVANLGQVNLLATYFIWSLFGVLLLLQRSLRPALALGLVFVLTVGLALTRSRMGLVFGLGLAAALWLPWALRPSQLKSRAALTASLVLGYAAGTVAISFFVAYHGAAVDNAVQRFGEAGGFADRVVMWGDALKVAATAPWLGVGFGDYAAHQYWVVQPGPHAQATTYAHNLVLHTAAELGWPMAALLALVGVWWVVAQWKERIGASETAFAGALVVIIGMHSMLEWPLASLHFAIPAALLFAMAEPRTATVARAAANVDSRLLVVVGVAGLILALPMKLEFDELSDVTARADSGRRSGKGIDEATVMRMLALSETARLRVYADSLLVYLRAPTAVEANDLEIDRHERLLILGADPRLIARLVILYAKAGRMEESVRHAERLRVFDRGLYGDLGRMVLDALAPLSDTADPVRRQLAIVGSSPAQ